MGDRISRKMVSVLRLTVILFKLFSVALSFKLKNPVTQFFQIFEQSVLLSARSFGTIPELEFSE